MRNPLVGIAKKGAQVGGEVRERTAGYLGTAFGLVAGLAWNDAVNALISNLFTLEKNTVIAKFVYAVAITMFVVLVTAWLVRKPKEEKKEEKK